MTGNNLLLAIPAALLSSTLLSIITEPLFRPLIKRRAANQTFVMAIGIAMILTHVMGKHLHQGMPIAFPENLSSHEAAIRIGTTVLSAGQIYTFLRNELLR